MLASHEHRGAKLGKQNVVRCSAKHEIVGSTNNEETAANTPGHPMKLQPLKGGHLIGTSENGVTWCCDLREKFINPSKRPSDN